MRFLPPLALLASLALADGPKDNIPSKVRPVPPKGFAIADMDRSDLAGRASELEKAIAALAKSPLRRLLPDVLVFHKAVDWALRHDEFFGAGDVAAARKLLDEGMARAKQLRAGKPAWIAKDGLVVRGYRSRIDDSVQPYGLVVPKGYDPGRDRPYRLDVWLHGRFENTTELRFISERMRSTGQFAPRGAFVLHPFGRFSNAFKLAGEVDVLEALAHARKSYPIDEDRLVMRGFSMGGAGCWQMAAHYPGKWCAAAPGAGFSETAKFLKVFQDEKAAPTWYEKELWQLYDVPGYAMNFHGLPTVAYSGEKDKQKQAADVMQEALKAEGIALVHLIGPGTGHSYHPLARAELNRRIDRLAAIGRERVPKRVRFTTPTLRYDECRWVRLLGLQEHWKPASVDASIKDGGIVIKTENVSALALRFGPGDAPFVERASPVAIDGSKLAVGPPTSDRSFAATFVREGKAWKRGKPEGLAKRPGLQGPIDDAFLDRFLIVRPTGKPMHEKTGRWAQDEMVRAIREWRRQFRGDALAKDDKDVTDADIKSSNLILWGDPSSNSIIRKVAAKLPLQWDEKELAVNGKAHSAAGHMPAMIYPNPLEPSRYVVLNSGFTYREYDYLNNARQHAKLPDWAVIDLATPPGTRWPGKIDDAGFYDERWKPKARKE